MKTTIKARTYVQIFFFLFIAAIAVNHGLEETGQGIPFLSAASLHALCPFGGVVTIYQKISTGLFVQKIHESSLVLLYSVIVLALFFGPVFCGWVCPLGTLQEWIGKLGKKIFKRKYNNFIPYSIDSKLRYIRYIVLGIVVYMTAKTAVLLFVNVDPYYAMFNFWTGEVALPALAVLALTMAGSLFVERPWCKYACPFGAFLGIFNLFRIFQIRRNDSTCINCGACGKACPMNIRVDEKKTIRDHQCISCMICTSEGVCPVPDTVELKTGGGRDEN
ncbi:MAG TPA: 4Fe-4S binding protein [Clostridia bacterium]|nr:4Fe-4S binding protein [Clostridia bacterium]